MKIRSILILTCILLITAGAVQSAPIHDAAARGDVVKVQKLLGKNSKLINIKDDSGQTPLIKAAYADKTAVVKELLARGANAGTKDVWGMTALHWAAYNCNKSIVNMLLVKGISIDVKDASGGTALFCVTGGNSEGIFACEDDSGCPNMTEAAKHDEKRRADMAAYLMSKGAKLQAKNTCGRTALHEAAWAGCSTVVTYLISRGLSPDTADNKGMTALHLASLAGHNLAAKALLASGANVDAADNNGQTPLHYALNSAVAQVLVEGGANILAKNKNGKNPGQVADDEGRDNVARYLMIPN